MSPRVVHVTTTDISLALLLGPQLRAMGDAGYEVLGASAPGPWASRLEALGVEHVPLAHATRTWAPVEDVKALIELIRLFRRLRPDVVHTHNPKPGVYGRIAAGLARTPVVVNTVHGLYALPEDRRRKRWPVYALERLASVWSDAELVQGSEDVEVLASIGIPRRKLVHLGNGIDLARFDPGAVTHVERAAVRAQIGAAPDDVVVGVVGRLVREKGLDEVFEAARLLRDASPRTVFAVVGIAEPDKRDGYTASQLESMAADAGVVLLGTRDDMPACYSAMDVLAFASYREGVPRAPMEAAAMGKPVVATDVRGCRDVVEHGVNGLLVPVRDGQAIADAVRSLAVDGARRDALGAAGRRMAQERFDERLVLERTLDVYRRELARRGRRSSSAPRRR